jgi:hypothetical protein
MAAFAPFICPSPPPIPHHKQLEVTSLPQYDGSSAPATNEPAQEFPQTINVFKGSDLHVTPSQGSLKEKYCFVLADEKRQPICALADHFSIGKDNRYEMLQQRVTFVLHTAASFNAPIRAAWVFKRRFKNDPWDELQLWPACANGNRERVNVEMLG